MSTASIDVLFGSGDYLLINIGSVNYRIFKSLQLESGKDIPRLIVVSYLPDSKTVNLLKYCIDSIFKFTEDPFELWVVDNNSPKENIEWLLDINNINIIFNRTDPKEVGSYANALGLELAREFIPGDTRYLMTLHQDTVVCREGWLTYLLSKFDDKVKAVGVRRDCARVKTGILHVLGYIVDYQVFQELQLDFYPDLPGYDVGDKAIYKIKSAGYDIFATDNSLREEHVINSLPTYPPYRQLQVDRSVDEDSNVIFMHLGRGVVKTTATKNKHDSASSLGSWSHFVESYLLEKDCFQTGVYREYVDCLYQIEFYTLRRYFVDTFYKKYIGFLPEGGLVLDIGGKKIEKRGLFNIEKTSLNVKYANIDSSTHPDFHCNGADVPIDSETFQGVILSEVVEHLLDPIEVLAEAYRVLAPGGLILLTAPFLFHQHADPQDFGRYTSDWYRVKMEELGFKDLFVERQGGFGLVLSNMLGLWHQQRVVQQQYYSVVDRSLMQMVLNQVRKIAFWWDSQESVQQNRVFAGHTTGFGVIGKK